MQELNTNFKDEQAREWTARLTVPVVHRYCQTKRLKLGDLVKTKTETVDGEEKQTPTLTEADFVELAYYGTRHQARAKAGNESLDEFLAALEGPSYLNAAEAGANALANFFLKLAPPAKKADAVTDAPGEPPTNGPLLT